MSKWLAWALAACLVVPAWAAGGGRAAAGDSVLLLSSAPHPLIDDLAQQLKAGGRGSPPLPPLNVLVAHVPDARSAAARAEQEVRTNPRLRAVFALNQYYGRAVQQQVPGIPLVFTGVSDPVRRCLVDSLAQPGRSATGFMHWVPDSTSKMLDLLLLSFPEVRRVVVPYQAAGQAATACDVLAERDVVPRAACRPTLEPFNHRIEARLATRALVDFASSRGVEVLFAAVCEYPDLRPLLERAARDSGTGVLVPWQDIFESNRRTLVREIEALRLPAIHPNQRHIQEGALLAVDIEFVRGRDNAALLMLVEVLNGRSPAMLPVQSPHGLSFHVNAAAAARTGLRPSVTALRRADRIVPP